MRQILFAIAIFLVSCNQISNRANVSESPGVSATDKAQVATPLRLFDDTLKFTILKKQSDIQYAFHGKYSTDTVSYADLAAIENRMLHAIDSFNLEGRKRMDKIQREVGRSVKINKNHFVIDTSRYKFQIVSALSDKNQREVWVNAFCDDNTSSWRTELMVVKDGGVCYFKFAINLTTMQTLYFDVNGDI